MIAVEKLVIIHTTPETPEQSGSPCALRSSPECQKTFAVLLSDGLTGHYEQTCWGGQQYLNTSTLGAGLLQPVLNRLLTAMHDALAVRNRGGSASP
jgi:hypothetical protein